MYALISCMSYESCLSGNHCVIYRIRAERCLAFFNAMKIRKIKGKQLANERELFAFYFSCFYRNSVI